MTGKLAEKNGETRVKVQLSLGQWATVLGILVSIVAFFVRLEGRVDRNGRENEHQDDAIGEIKVVNEKALNEIKQEQRDQRSLLQQVLAESRQSRNR